MVDASFIYDSSLSASARVIFISIIESAGESRKTTLSDREVAEKFGISKRSVQRYLSELEERGYIEREIIYVGNTKEIYKRIITLKN